MTVLFVSENVAAITNYVDIYLKCVESLLFRLYLSMYIEMEFRNGIWE